MQANSDILSQAYHVLETLWLSRIIFLFLVISPALIAYFQKDKFTKKMGEADFFKSFISSIIAIFIVFIVSIFMLTIDNINLYRYSKLYIKSTSCFVTKKGRVYSQLFKQEGIYCSQNKHYVYRDFFDFSNRIDEFAEGEKYTIYYLPKTKMIIYSEAA